VGEKFLKDLIGICQVLHVIQRGCGLESSGMDCDRSVIAKAEVFWSSCIASVVAVAEVEIFWYGHVWGSHGGKTKSASLVRSGPLSFLKDQLMMS
jgi:hypothetical protein